MPFKSSLARSAGKLFGVFDAEDLDLRGKEIAANQIPPPPPSELSGGTAFPAPGSPKQYIRFQSSGSLVIVEADATVDLLVVGGGGAGGSYAPGNYAGGGGGGGGVRWCPNVSLPIGTYPVVVGDGGTGANPGGPPYDGGYPTGTGTGGNSSTFNPGDANSVPAITATGGGGGGSGGSAYQGTGGSAGGASYSPSNTEKAGNTGGDEPRADPVREGSPNFPTGRGPAPTYGCCGGGGAGDVAAVPGTLSLPRQNGVPGITLPGIGSPGDPWLPSAGNVFGGGGGGGSYKGTGGNGTGGPGGGGSAGTSGSVGTDYTGGGGGGGSSSGGGNGGYGVIYIATPTDYIINPA